MHEYTKDEIETLLKELMDDLSTRGHMDHMTIALQRALEEKIPALFPGKDLKGKVWFSISKQAVSANQYNLHFNMNKGERPGNKHPHCSIGKCFLWKPKDDRYYGAFIVFAVHDNVNQPTQRLVVAHELAHLLLHVDWQDPESIIKASQPIGIDSRMTDRQETEAFYFAKLALRERSRQYTDSSHRTLHTLSDADVDTLIKGIHPEYDEKQL